MPPEVLLGIAVQIPLVAAVAWAFTTGKIHSHSEMVRREEEHQAELKRRTDTLTEQVNDWRTLYNQERQDRIEADRRLTTATNELKEVTSEVKELTKEVIRGGRN